MPLSWNEIKSRALAFSKHWADAGNEDAEAKPFLIAFLFSLYQQLTSLLPPEKSPSRQRRVSKGIA